MNSLNCGPIKHLILLGSAPVFKEISAWCAKQDVKLTIFTSPAQEKELDQELDFIVTQGIDSQEVENIVHSEPMQNTLAISFGARWIFKKHHIEELFENKLINAHGTRLPFDRGGGGFSWRIMKRDRLGSLNLHRIDEGIDTGEILIQKTYVIPKACTTPEEIGKDYFNRLGKFITEFLESIRTSERAIDLVKQNENLSYYYPRLYTMKNSWVNWEMNAENLESFITAFDAPYAGALTNWNGQKCSIRKVQVHGGEVYSHPFMAGIILRKEEDWLICATACGKTLIIEEVNNEEGNSIMANLKVGDRFYTSSEDLHEAKSSRITVTATKIKS